MRTLSLLGAAVIAVNAVLGCDARTPASRQAASVGTDVARPGLQDSAEARGAVEQYLGALARREYDAAARLHVAEWRQLAPGLLEYAPDSLTFAGFLRLHCERGFYVCGLRLERVTDVRVQAPDTLLVSFWSIDSTGARYRWGPCCGDDGGQDSTNMLRVVARDRGYAVVGLPLYIP